MSVAKVIVDDTTIMDITDTTAIASDVASGKYFYTADGSKVLGTGDIWMEQTITTDGAVTQSLNAHVFYHFTGNLTSLTITLNETEGIAHYHFDFISGATAPTLTMPNTITMPDSFALSTYKRYEVDILNNYGSAIAWTV